MGEAMSVKTPKVPGIEVRETAGEMKGAAVTVTPPTEATVLCGHFVVSSLEAPV